VSGWLLILALLVLGGVLAHPGRSAGSRVGKARLSCSICAPQNRRTDHGAHRQPDHVGVLGLNC